MPGTGGARRVTRKIKKFRKNRLTIFLFWNTLWVRRGTCNVFDITFYERENGERPVEDFLDSLNAKMRAKAVRSLELLEEFGNRLTEPHSKYLSDGIFELRIKFAGDISRIFYFFFVQNKIVLTNGFIKKTQATPKSELGRAKKYKADYERRFSHE